MSFNNVKEYTRPIKYKIKYQTITVTLPFDPRNHICDACGQDVRDGKIKNTQMHHWLYAYKPETVKENPELALHNTKEYDFYCHQIADGLRAILTARPDRVVDVMKTLPFESRERLLGILAEIITFWNKEARGRDEAIKNIQENLGFV